MKKQRTDNSRAKYNFTISLQELDNINQISLFKISISICDFIIRIESYNDDQIRCILNYLFDYFIVTIAECPALDSCIIENIKSRYIIRDRTDISFDRETNNIILKYEIRNNSFIQQDINIFISDTINKWINLCDQNIDNLKMATDSITDQYALREFVKANGGVCFIANGSLLVDNISIVNMEQDNQDVIPFKSPKSLEVEFELPNKGSITGMLIPQGVNVIVGGGFHGKSTLLKAIINGIQDKKVGDPTEFVVTNKNSLNIHIEEGRSVTNVDISPFFTNLPKACNINPSNFSTNCASGSTSMASSIIEAIELDVELFLLDEDKCASNFLIRDSRMRTLVPNESAIPFIYRVNSLYKELNISTIIVIGGCGDWLDVQDHTIMLNNYECIDVTDKSISIRKSFCTGRVQFNGKGLVHQLEWPDNNNIKRYIIYPSKTFTLSEYYDLIPEVLKSIKDINNINIKINLLLNILKFKFIIKIKENEKLLLINNKIIDLSKGVLEELMKLDSHNNISNKLKMKGFGYAYFIIEILLIIKYLNNNNEILEINSIQDSYYLLSDLLIDYDNYINNNNNNNFYSLIFPTKLELGLFLNRTNIIRIDFKY